MIRSSATIILEVKAKHPGRAAKALRSGFLREQSLKNGMEKYYQRAFGVRGLVSKIQLNADFFAHDCLSNVDWISAGCGKTILT